MALLILMICIVLDGGKDMRQKLKLVFKAFLLKLDRINLDLKTFKLMFHKLTILLAIAFDLFLNRCEPVSLR